MADPTGAPLRPDPTWLERNADIIVRLVGTLGFPILVAGALLWFLLWQFPPTMEKFTTAVSSLTSAVSKVSDTVERDRQERVAERRDREEERRLTIDTNDRVRRLQGERPWDAPPVLPRLPAVPRPSTP